MSIIVPTFIVPRGLSSFAPSYDCWRDFFEVPSGTIDNSPPFLTVGCPHHKTLPVPQPRDERTEPMVSSRILPSTGRAIQRPRSMAHNLRSERVRVGFLSSLAGLVPLPTVTHRYKRWAWSLDLFPEHRRSIFDNARGCRLGGGGFSHGLKARRARGGGKLGSALGELLA